MLCAPPLPPYHTTHHQAYKTYRLGGEISELLYSPATYGIDLSSRDYIKPRARAAPMLCVLRNTLWMLGGQVEISHTDIVLGEWVGRRVDVWPLYSPIPEPLLPLLYQALLAHRPPADDIWSLDLAKLDGWKCVRENTVGEEAFRELGSDDWETGSEEEQAEGDSD